MTSNDLVSQSGQTISLKKTFIVNLLYIEKWHIFVNVCDVLVFMYWLYTNT